MVGSRTASRAHPGRTKIIRSLVRVAPERRASTKTGNRRFVVSRLDPPPRDHDGEGPVGPGTQIWLIVLSVVIVMGTLYFIVSTVI
jgi:hypothetical protein